MAASAKRMQFGSARSFLAADDKRFQADISKIKRTKCAEVDRQNAYWVMNVNNGLISCPPEESAVVISWSHY